MNRHEDAAAETRGWYGPPNSRRFHYFDPDGRSLCGKWLVLAGLSESMIDRAFGPANGDCVACRRALDKREAESRV